MLFTFFLLIIKKIKISLQGVNRGELFKYVPRVLDYLHNRRNIDSLEFLVGIMLENVTVPPLRLRFHCLLLVWEIGISK